jgi:hypothetical protein
MSIAVAASPIAPCTLSCSISAAPKLLHVRQRDLERAARHPEPAHAVREPRLPEADLRHLEAVADVQQHVLVGDLEPVERELAVPAVFFRPHDGDAAHDAPTRLAGVEEERRKASALVVRRARDQDKVLRFPGAGDEPLAAGDAPAAGRALCPRVHQRGIGARAAVGFGHCERRTHLARNDRREPAFFLCGRRDLGENGHVPVVGCRTVECDRAEDRTAHLFVEHGDLGDRAAETAIGFGDLWCPQSAPLDEFAQCIEVFEVDVLVLVVSGGICF